MPEARTGQESPSSRERHRGSECGEATERHPDRRLSQAVRTFRTGPAGLLEEGVGREAWSFHVGPLVQECGDGFAGKGPVEMVTRGSAGFPGGKGDTQTAACVFSAGECSGAAVGTLLSGFRAIPIGVWLLARQAQPALPGLGGVSWLASLDSPRPKAAGCSLRLDSHRPKTPRNKPNLPEKLSASVRERTDG